MITERLEAKLQEVMNAAPALDSAMVNAVFECYHRLREMRALNGVLELTVLTSLETVCTRLICKQVCYVLLLILSYFEKNNKKKVKVLGEVYGREDKAREELPQAVSVAESVAVYGVLYGDLRSRV